jgi:hypothetical protein
MCLGGPVRWTTLLIDRPWLSLIPAAAFLWLWAVSHSRAVLVAAILWVAYALWEYSVRVFSPDSDIRVDLLLIYPVLAATTLLAVWSGLRRFLR